MAQLESSPSVRRSNSYRVALRKSGIPKEYIDELERMEANEAISSNNNKPAKTAEEEQPKKTVFKRNFRGAHNKRKNVDTNNQCSTIDAISINAKDTQLMSTDCDGANNNNVEMTNNDNRGNCSSTGHEAKSVQTPKQSPCAHWLCLVCCCNYCVFLPVSLRTRLRKESPKTS